MKVLLVANWDYVLWHFRLPLARELRQNGLEVVMVCPAGAYTSRLQEQGFRVVQWRLKRRSFNPWLELSSIEHLAAIYRKERPALAHHFTIKPNLYGSLAAALCRVPSVINTWTGLGWTFSQDPKGRVLQALLFPLMRSVFRRKAVWSVFQNEQDMRRFEVLRLVSSGGTALIFGSGVDTERFFPTSETRSGPPVILMASRLLWDKGVQEFVTTAEKLKRQGVMARFLLVGEPDSGNPRAVPQKLVEEWRRKGVVELLGQRNDMPDLLRSTSVAVLPTYYEGLPLFLLEAMASGVPVVTTDIPGCRVAVEDGINGLLVPPRNEEALAEAIKRLLADPDLRARMGRAGRQRALSFFDQRIILRQWLKVYELVLAGGNQGGESGASHEERPLQAAL